MGTDDISDITTLYKGAEKLVVDDSNEVSFRLITERVPLGETLNVTIRVTNNSNSTKNLRVVLAGKSVYYTGKLASMIDQRDDNYIIKEGETRTLPPLSMPASKYNPTLVDHGFIKLYAYGEVITPQLDGQRWAEEEDFIFTPPSVTISTGKLYYAVGDTIDVRFRYVWTVRCFIKV